jgi:hypothetical protein
MPNREYRLVVAGELSNKTGSAFDEMTVTPKNGTTVINGLVRDQAHLQGLLQRISDLGLTLLSANATGDEIEGEQGTAP